jgi:hypothetical protein
VELEPWAPVQAPKTENKGMKLRRPGQSERWRVAVLVAVVGLHFLIGFLIFATGTIRIARLRVVDSPLSLLALSQESQLKAPATLPESIPTQNLRRREALREIDRPASVVEPEPNNAITLPLDLKLDAGAAARRQADKEESERRWRNLAGPSESQLEWSRNNVPLVRDYHQLGDGEHAEGGELITWVNDKCYFTTHGITTFGMPETNKVCKDPPKPETELFKDMRKKLDERAKARAP